MTAPHAAQLIEDYLRRLEAELADMPAERRAEIVDEIRGHVADERAAMRDETDADVMNLLDRIGDPAEIAAEARGTRHSPRPRSTRAFGTLEVLALALLIAAWPVGAILLWTSHAWSNREKVLGTLVPPGGYPGVFLIMSTFPSIADALDPTPHWFRILVGAVLFTISLVLLLAPIGMCVYLARRLQSSLRQLSSAGF